MKGKKILTLFIGLIAVTNLSAQSFADFETTATTPSISAAGESKVLANPFVDEINTTPNTAYYNKLSGNWHNVTLLFPDTVFVHNNNSLKFLAHCSKQGRVYVNFWKGSEVLEEGWAHEYNSMPEAGIWVSLTKDISTLRGNCFTKLEIAFCVDNHDAANVYFDEFELLNIVKPTALFYALESGNAFSASMVEGTQLGEFPVGSKAELDAALTYATSILKIQDDVSYGFADTTAFDLNNIMSMVEAKVVKQANNLLDTKASYQTVNMYQNLKHIAASKHQLFGMHNARTYGINEDGSSWNDDGTASKSDLKVVTGSHGAISSYDASEIVGKSFGEKLNYRSRIVSSYDEGEVTTIAWHMDDPRHGAFYWKDIEAAGTYNVVESINEGGEYHDWYKGQLYTLASFFKGLRGSKGEAIPLIFRPYHEHTGNWFWWGKTRCSTEEYNQLWQFTVHYLRDSLNVHNVIYAFSPDASTISSREGYLSIYPGNEYIDIFGLDYYFDGGNDKPAHLTKMLEVVVELANEQNKVAALTETGNDGINPSTWYTSSLLKGIQGSELSQQIAYYATWRNAGPNHHYVPYPGHDAVSDFLRFYDDTTTLFLNDMLNVYDTLLRNKVRLPSNSSHLNLFSIENNEGVKFEDANISILMAEGTNISALITSFEASQGAYVEVNNVIQESGVTVNNFSEALTYTVVSESGTVSSAYSVRVDYSALTKLFVTPESVHLNVGDSNQFEANGYNQYNEKMSTWSATSDELFTASTGVVSVQSSIVDWDNASVQIIDNAGQIILSNETDSAVQIEQGLEFDLSDLPNGVYFLVLHDNERSINHKIIKQ